MIFAITEKGFPVNFPFNPFWEMGKLWENHETSATIMHQLVERERVLLHLIWVICIYL
jgi:hypothetical protein